LIQPQNGVPFPAERYSICRDLQADRRVAQAREAVVRGQIGRIVSMNATRNLPASIRGGVAAICAAEESAATGEVV